MKKFLCAFLSLVLFFGALPTGIFKTSVKAAEGKEEYYFYSVSGGEATITDVAESISGDIIIPSTLGGFPVTAIGYDAFRNCTALKSVFIPGSVESIGSYAFASAGLVSITLPDSLEYIESAVFRSCTALKSIDIPENVTSIGSYAFYNCTALSNVSLPQGVTSIENSAFACSGIAEITIPDSLITVGSNAFSNCESLTKVYHYCSIGIDDIIIGGGNDKLTGVSWEGIHNFDANNICTRCEEQKLNEWEYTVSNGEATIIGIKSAPSGNVVFPSTIDGFNVTAIGSRALTDCSNVLSFTFPESITYISSYAFNKCTSIESVTVAEGNKSYYSKDNCVIETATNTLILGCKNSIIPSDIKSIGACAFSYCTVLEKVELPEGIESIGAHAFTFCTALSDIKIPDGVKIIGQGAFWGCTSIESVTIPDSVTEIGSSAFYICSGLSSIIIPDSVTAINSCTFELCTGLTSVTICGGVKIIGDSAFEKCTALVDVIIENGVEVIEGSAFYYCTALEDIIIPDSVTKLGSAFYGCSNLKTVTFGRGLHILDSYAFRECTKLETIYYPCDIDIVNLPDFNKNDSLVNASKEVVHNYSTSTVFPTCTQQGYTLCTCTKCFTSYKTDCTEPLGHKIGLNGLCEICGDGERIVWQYEFSNGTATITSVNASNNTSIEIPAMVDGYKVTAIGIGVFENFTSLKTVVIPEGIETIGARAFSGCTELVSVTMPNSVKEIRDNAFSFCTVLEDFNIPSGIKFIGRFAFEDCKSIKKLSFPRGFKTLSDGAFSGCLGLTEVTLQHGITVIGERAFKDCTSLKSIELPKGITTIRNSAFIGCTNLERIVLPQNLENIGKYTFYGCTALKTIDIPSGVEVIGEYVFYNCAKLNNIYLPLSIKAIEKYAFDGCSSLRIISYDGTPEDWDNISIATGNLKFINATKDYIHKYVAEVIAPTCSEDGYILYTCTCGDSYKSDIVSKTGHCFDLDTVLYKIDATCTAEGYKIMICDNCKQSVALTIFATGHSMTFTNTVVPTASTQGYDLYTCANGCGHTEKKNIVCFVENAPLNSVNNVKTTASDVGVTLSWNGFSGAEEYYAKVYDANFTTCLKTITTQNTSAFFDYKILSYNKDYKFIVTAKLRSGGYLTVADATRVEGSMKVGTRVVGHALTMEGKGAIVDFLPVENATEYLVNVFENDANGTRIYTATLDKNTTTARIMNNLVAGTKYVVMINAKVDGAYMSLADLRERGIGISFTAPVYSPTKVTIAAETATSIRFNWDAVRGATQYFIKVTEKETGKLVNTINVVGKTTATLSRWTDGTKISPNTTYLIQFYIYVNSKTNSKKYGEPIEITTKNHEKISVTVIKNSGKINLSWNGTTNAIGYFVYTYKNGEKIATMYVEGKDNKTLSFKAPAASGTYTYGVIVCEKNTSGTNYTPIVVSNSIRVY